MEQPDLDAIEARANAATRGPWVVETPESVYGYDGGPDWADLRWVSDEDTVGDDDPPWLGPMLTADAEFIAYARTDVPALVVALREARAEVERMRTGEADSIAVLSVAWPTTTVPWIAETGVAACVSLLTSERDDWRRRYEALRDGVTGLCERAERNYGGPAAMANLEAWVHLDYLRAVVARVEES